MDIIRVDKFLRENDCSELPDSMREVNAVIDYLVNREVTGDSLAVVNYKNSRSFQVFAHDIEENFTVQDSLENVLGAIDARLKNISGNEKGLGRVYGLVIPYNVPVITTDSTIVVGLNHYLGSDYPGYEGFDEYKVRAKRAAHLPYDVAEARIVADNPIKLNNGATLLNGMLYWGAVANYVEMVIPGADLKEIFNLTNDELEWLKTNSEKVWAQMIERQFVYSTNPDIADRLLYPAPKSFLISNDAPGMTGRYIGYLIVKSYLKNHPETSVQEMLSPEIYNSENTLVKSGFTGK